MKNQYFGDLSDYKKYAILRTLVRDANLKTLLCWMLTDNDSRNDGKHTAYLSAPDVWRRYDPEVFDLLAISILKHRRRDIALIENSGLLFETRYHSATIHDDASLRNDYFLSLHRDLGDADLVFLDPDNGLQVKSVDYGRRNSSKYLFINEVTALFQKDVSLLVYQHFSRTDRAALIRDVSLRLMDATKATKIFSLKTRHTVFFLVPQPKHVANLIKALSCINQCWGDLILLSQHDREKVTSLNVHDQLVLL